MIPPLKAMRLRSISRWLADSQPKTPPPEELSSRASELDEQMVEAFEQAEDSLKDSMMKAGTWGTGEGMQTFQTDRLSLWNQVLADFLPEISAQQLED
jgi:hypothetical protein